MGFLCDLIEHGFAALSASAAMAPQGRDEIRRLVEEFREERANDIAQLADRARRSGERLAIMSRERDAWQDYAKELERRCLAEGVEVPPAPDEM